MSNEETASPTDFVNEETAFLTDFVSVVTAEAAKRTKQIDAELKKLRTDRHEINSSIRALQTERIGVARVASAAAPRTRSKKAAPAAPAFSPAD